MGNRTGKMSYCDEKHKNSKAAISDDVAQNRYHQDHLQSNTVGDENIYVTERSDNRSIGSRQDSINASSVSVWTGSSSDLSTRAVQHIIRENTSTIHIKDSNNAHIGDKINCYGPVSIVSSSQSNVQVINQQSSPIVHDFEIGTDSTAQLCIKRRSEWFAKPPKTQLKRMNLPNQVIIAHTESSDTRMPDFNMVRNIQDFHMQTKKWDDIGYNFLIARNGTVFVGRGWLYQGAHSRDYNKECVCIAFIGKFNTEIPSTAALNAAKQLIKRGVDIGKLDGNYRLYGHCQVVLTESPGANLYEAIQTWDDFTSEVQPPN